MVSLVHSITKDTILWLLAVELKLIGWQVTTVVSLLIASETVLLVMVDSPPTPSVVVAVAPLKALQV
jgi:membrane-anchored glycerophosphoryl diester phosphodiesterase (GDPDase)